MRHRLGIRPQESDREDRTVKRTLSEEVRDRIFGDPQWEGYFGVELLDHQPPWYVPDEWRERKDDYMAPEFRREIVGHHADFLESLFDKDGNALLYRAVDSKGFRGKLPRRGDRANIGKYFTYSTDAELYDAQISSNVEFDTVFVAKVAFDQVDWPQTIADHVMRHYGEKQIFVNGPVRIVGKFPFKELRKRAKTRDFDRWLKKRIRPSLSGLEDIPLPPNIDRPEMWTPQAIVQAVRNGFTFMIPFIWGKSLFSQNAYWIAGFQYGAAGFTVGPEHTPEITIIEPDSWIRAKTYFQPEMVPERAWLGPPNENGVVPVYVEIDSETIDWELLNRGHQIRVKRGLL